MYDRTDSFYGFYITFRKHSRKRMEIVAYNCSGICFSTTVVKGCNQMNLTHLGAFVKAIRDYCKFGMRSSQSKYVRLAKVVGESEYRVSPVDQIGTVEGNFTEFSKFLYLFKCDTGIDVCSWMTFASRRGWFNV